MNDGTSEPKCCESCGKRLASHNRSGICSTNPGCRKALKQRRARSRSTAGRKQCGHPDGCPNLSRRNGLCGTHDARLKKTGELGPAGLIRKPLEIPAGSVFGNWVTLEDYDPKVSRRILCRCKCGIERRVDASALKKGTSLSCGCLNGRAPRPLRTGRVYLSAGTVSGRLTALEDATYSDDRIRFSCECGNETVKDAYSVKHGETRSCNCLVAENWRTHGLSSHPLYSTWYGIHHRCENPANVAWDDYGGRGITVCERWSGLPDGLLSFTADMGPRPAGRTIDRRDNDDGYHCGRCAECTRNGWPANAVWGTQEEQTVNRRSVRKLTRERDALAAEVERLSRLLAGEGDN